VARPTTSYAWNDGVAIAYQVVGTGGPDLLFAPGSITHLDVQWDEPRVHRFFMRIAGFCRLILMDPRGLGLSDRLTEVPTMADRVGDLMAVLDAAGSERATLFGNADTGPPCIAAAVERPERVEGLILLGTYAKATRSEDYPLGWTEEDFAELREFVKKEWGSPGSTREVAPSRAGDAAFQDWYSTLSRLGASPTAVLLLSEMTSKVDVRPLLSRIAVPALVMHRTGDRVNSVEIGRDLAPRIPGARWVELPGDDFVVWAGDLDRLADEIEEFLTGRRGAAEPTRVVATVMFTDVVGSTELARSLGDRQWADLLESHNSRIRTELGRHGGREIDTAGDGFLASFTSPTQAIRCAKAMVRAVSEIGVELRVGMHTGECEVVGDKLRGMAVHIGARVASQAGPGEILVSQTVKDLVVGSGIELDDRGTHELKGIPGEWRLYAVLPEGGAGQGS
jgi:class 3 adenylate cyclase